MFARAARLRNGQFTKLTMYDVHVIGVGGGGEAIIRINFMLGTFHQLKSTIHKKST